MAKDNFNIIYERNYQRSFMFAKSYVHDDMIAEDIVSDSLVKYWRLISTQKGEATEALLLSILRNKALDYLRHKAVHDAAIENLEEIKKRELSIRISTLEACDPEEIFREQGVPVHRFPWWRRILHPRHRSRLQEFCVRSGYLVQPMH